METLLPADFCGSGTFILCTAGALVVIYYASVALYNTTIHPLARVPGYRLAGMTNLYQLFWCYHNGRSVYYRKIREMHDQFGPIVRVSPNELSLRDPKDCETIYATHSKYTKDSTFYQTMGVRHGMFGAESNLDHRQLRAPWRQFFTNPSIKKLDGMIQSKVELLCQRLDQQLRQTGSAPVQDLLHSLSSDIVSHAFAVDTCLRQQDVSSACPEPKSLAHIMTAAYLSREAPAQTTITREVLIDELHSLMVAGTFNTGTIASTTLFHVLTNDSVRRRVIDELKTVQNKMTHAELEKLPYLSACVKEGFRLGYGPIGRLPRVVPEPGAFFQGYWIPAGSVVGVSSYVQHHNPDIWGHDHDDFNPNRWLDPTRAKHLNKYLLTFGKDARRCIGQRDFVHRSVVYSVDNMSTTDTIPNPDCDEMRPLPETSSEPDQIEAARIDDETMSPSSQSQPYDELEDIEALCCQVEKELKVSKNIVESAVQKWDLTEDDKDLQEFQGQIKELENFLECGKKLDSHRRSIQPPLEDNEGGALKFYKSLLRLTVDRLKKITAWQHALGNVGAISEADSQVAAGTDGGNGQAAVIENQN
ncbi:benzoate 4-monooxygenase cytochrome P450 [Verticillium dahliae VdLs.17]|uniref:Benzoate 4-monooxygenase cytochrome P450 n=2 Tax=Verticillium dahliae TaxID=27337 RepID=G2XFT8_VERDV|nr:benzoate 4-monooxygenase cytochrome P450 [Verticillium dahliae VdLs.17]EGY18686.1 benzoate 4-monooxygenase cytochrome P450 [Verticillium dahliae VdLs.17]